MICVTSVSVTPKSISINKNSWYYGLSATVLPSNATYKTVTWSSSNTNVATVNASNGYVYGNAAGTATIYATATDGSGKRDSCTVTVLANVPVTSVVVCPSSVSMYVGGTTSLSATVYPSNATNKTLNWSTTDPCVATVNQSGVVTATGGGTATIYATATDGSGKRGSCSISVQNVAVTSVAVCPESATINMGETLTLYTEVLPYNATDKSLTWQSSNGNVATVSNGVVSAHIPGQALITATSVSNTNKKAYCLVTVKGDVKITSIEICPTSAQMHLNETLSLYAAVYPYYATNKELFWSTTNECVAVVSQSGLVTATGAGTATIRATARDGSGKYATCTISVDSTILVKSVRITNKKEAIAIGTDYGLTAIVAPSNAQNKSLMWSSSNTSVVSVNPQTGVIHASTLGTSKIKAIAQDGSGVFDSFDINVIIPVTSFDMPGILEMKIGNTKTLTATVEPANASVKNIEWESDDTSIVSIAPGSDIYSVFLQSHKEGSCNISATLIDGGNQRTTIVCKINVSSENVPDDPTTHSDPIRVYKGAHIIENELMSLFGGQKIKLTASYRSDKLAFGILGRGWHHNFEKWVQFENNYAYLYTDPSTYIVFAQSNVTGVYNCITTTYHGYVLYHESSGQYPYRLNCNSQSTEYYDATGRLVKTVDHQGFEITITYLSNSIKVTDTITSKSLYLEIGTSGFVSRVYDDAGREASLYYEDDCLTEIRDVNGHTLKYAYDFFGRVLSGTDSKGKIYFNDTYNEDGKVERQEDGESAYTEFNYISENEIVITDRNDTRSIYHFNECGMLSSFTDADGNTTSYEYDGNFNKIRETYANGSSIQVSYNTFDKPTSIVDKNGNTTTLSYDSYGNVISIVYPSINGTTPSESFEYNARNQMTKHTDLRGTQTLFTYDSNGMLVSKKVGNKSAETYVYDNGLLISKTDPMGNTTLYGYNTLGQIVSCTDPYCAITTYEYDKSGNLLKTTDATGKTTLMSYDGNYQKILVADACGNTTKYEYNSNMKNTKVVLPDGTTIHYTYDGEDRLVKTTDQAGNETVFEYDALGRQVTKREPDGSTTRFEYDSVGNVIKEINSKGAVTSRTYDASGNVLSVTDEFGNTTLYQYNSMSKVTKITDAMLGETTYAYSSAGDLLQTTDAIGGTLCYTYDAYGNKLTATDAKGNVTYYTYDANDKLISTTDALGNTTTYTYNALGQIASVTDAKNHMVTYGYDALGRRTSITDAKGNTFTTVYDANGNVIKTLDANENTISETVYNCLNLPVAVTDGAGKSVTYSYNALGKVETITDQLGRTKKYKYDSRGKVTSVRDAKGYVSKASYDTLGNITELCGPLGGGTNYSYDNTGKMLSETTAYGGVVKYEYNALNLKESLTNARGQMHSYVYDAIGRIVQYSNAEGNTTFTYDANGNVLTVTDPKGTITRTFDALNRVTSYTDTFGKTIAYEYDAVGNLTKLTYPDNTFVSYAYDENNNLISVTDWANRTTTYTYDSNNRVVGVVKPDGSTTQITYDECQRIVSNVEMTSNSAIISGFEYVYDATGNIICEKALANGTKICYTYDKLSRVTKRTVKDFSDGVISEEEFAYDAAGNIVCSPENCCIDYDSNNKLERFDGKPVVYDADGNMLSAQIGWQKMIFEYDSANRLTFSNGVEYEYNAENVRIKKTVDEVETTYTHNTNTKLSQLLVSTKGNITTKYVYGLGLIGEEKSGSFKTYHFDYRGSTVAVTDTNGVVTDTFEYDTYGKLTSQTGVSEVFFAFNGRDGVMTDENGLIYMRARYYLPELRRFINADIVSGDISNAITLNRYAYANGNPVSFVDPSGLIAERFKNNPVDFYIDDDEIRSVLSKILNAFSEDPFKINSEKRMKIDLFTTVYYKNVVKSGNGSKLPITVQEQINMLLSAIPSEMTPKMNVSEEGMGITFFDDQNFEGSELSISLFYKYDISINLEFSVSTRFLDTATMKTTVGTCYMIPRPALEPATNPVPVPVTTPEYVDELIPYKKGDGILIHPQSQLPIPVYLPDFDPTLALNAILETLPLWFIILFCIPIIAIA